LDKNSIQLNAKNNKMTAFTVFKIQGFTKSKAKLQKQFSTTL